MGQYGTAYVPQNGTTVTLSKCDSCGGMYSQKDTHDKWSKTHTG